MAIATQAEVGIDQRQREREEVRGKGAPFVVFADARTFKGRIKYNAESFGLAKFIADRNTRSVIYATDLPALLSAR
jgi:hypothetical protein